MYIVFDDRAFIIISALRSLFGQGITTLTITEDRSTPPAHLNPQRKTVSQFLADFQPDPEADDYHVVVNNAGGIELAPVLLLLERSGVGYSVLKLWQDKAITIDQRRSTL